MSRQDALQLDESLDAGDVSRAWLVWLLKLRLLMLSVQWWTPSFKGLVLGRGSASFRVVRCESFRVFVMCLHGLDFVNVGVIFLPRFGFSSSISTV